MLGDYLNGLKIFFLDNCLDDGDIIKTIAVNKELKK